MNRSHNALQLLVNLGSTPTEFHRVLRHLQARSCNTTCVHSLAGTIGDASLDEGLDSLGGTTHIRYLGHNLNFVVHQHLGVVAVQLVLCCTRHCDVNLNLPRFAACHKHCSGETLGIGSNHVVARCAQVEHIFNLLVVESLGVVDVAVGSRDSHNLSAQLGSLLGSTPSHITEARNSHGLALNVVAHLREHTAQEIDCAIARSLGTNQRAAKGHTLACQHTCVLQSEFAIHTIQIAHFACTHSDVTRRYVGFGADVAPQLNHKSLAEAHNLAVGFAFGVEVRATLCAAHRQSG